MLLPGHDIQAIPNEAEIPYRNGLHFSHLCKLHLPFLAGWCNRVAPYVLGEEERAPPEGELYVKHHLEQILTVSDQGHVEMVQGGG